MQSWKGEKRTEAAEAVLRPTLRHPHVFQTNATFRMDGVKGATAPGKPGVLMAGGMTGRRQ